jgi:hypothetical protein
VPKDRASGKKDVGAPPIGGGAGPEVAPEVIKAWFAIHDKYGDPEKSGLKTTVGAGPNTYDILLD